MKQFVDKLQQVWQAQCHKPLDINPDQLLKTARIERRMIFLSDMFVVCVLVCVGMGMLSWAFRNIRRDWPWLVYTASDVWVIGFMLFNQWRRRRQAAHYDEPLLAHVEWSIKDIEYRMRQDRRTFWWYTLPLALGCMIPPTLSFIMDWIRKPQWHARFALLSTLLLALGCFAAIFVFVHLAIKWGLHKAHAARRRELEALRALRENLLNSEEPQI